MNEVRGRRHRLRALPVVAVALVAAALATLAYYAEPLRRVELSLYDARTAVGHPRPALDDVVIVGIDGRTERDLRRRFPFQRTFHARMIDTLREAGARVIAYDLEFADPRTRREDFALLDALERARGKVVLAASVGDDGKVAVLGGQRLIAEVGAVVGDSGLLFDSDGVVRRVTFRPHAVPTFAEAAAEVGGGPPVQEEDYNVEPGGLSSGEPGVRTSWLTFAGPPRSVRTYSFSRVLDGTVPAATFRDKVVVVGATSPDIGDVHRTAASGDQLMTGPEVQANAIATTLDDLPLETAPDWVNLALIALLAGGPALAAGRLGMRAVLVTALVLLVGFLIGAQLAFRGGAVVTVTYPLIALLLGTAGAFGVRHVAELRARRKTRSLFEQFVPQPVVDDAVRRRTGTDLRAPVRLDATVLFSDLRGFTTFAEKLPEETVSDVLNRYLGTMSEAIEAENGTVVSYMGDGIMAVFGAPAASEDHADRSIAAARAMLERLDDFNDYLRGQGLGEGFRMGIGLNSGTVISGNLGSDRHLEYAAIGDTTNIAARLEAMTKETGHSVLVAESTRERLGDACEDLVHVGEVPVRGRDAAVEVWALSPRATAPAPPARSPAAGS
jgi:adenylate cyclase